MRKITKKWMGAFLAFLLLTGLFAGTASAATAKAEKTGIKLSIAAAGEYRNWDGVSNVAQFVDNKGHYCFAYDNGKYVTVVKTKKGKVTQKSTRFSKDAKLNPCQMPVFAEGAVCWTGNKYGSGTNDVYIYRLNLDK